MLGLFQTLGFRAKGLEGRRIHRGRLPIYHGHRFRGGSWMELLKDPFRFLGIPSADATLSITSGGPKCLRMPIASEVLE